MSFTEQLKQTTGQDVVHELMVDAYATFKSGALEAAQRHYNYYKSCLMVDKSNEIPGQKKEKTILYLNDKEDIKRSLQLFLVFAEKDGFKIDSAKILNTFVPRQKRNIFGKIVEATPLEVFYIEVVASW